MKRLFPNIKNSQRVRVIINGVGVYLQVKDIPNAFAMTNQRIAVTHALTHVGYQKLQSFGKTYSIYDNQMKNSNIDLQVDLV